MQITCVCVLNVSQDVDKADLFLQNKLIILNHFSALGLLWKNCFNIKSKMIMSIKIDVMHCPEGKA